MKLPAGVLSALESAINRYLQLDPEAAARLAKLSGKHIGMVLKGIDLEMFVTTDGNRIHLHESIDGEADTVLRGTPLGMLQLGLGSNTQKTLFGGDVQIEGDVETGQTFKEILDAVDIDWEEQLSRLTGDFVAHRIGNAARTARRVLKHGRATLEQDISEYLQEELRVLPTRIENENFIADTRDIAMAIERLEARVSRLQEKPGNRRGD